MEAHWLLWVALALVAGVVEVFTLSLVFAMVAGGALAAAVVAAVTDSATASVLAFAVSTATMLLVVRPPLLRYSARLATGSLMGVAALVGQEALVTRAVSAADGEIKLAGEIWSARSHDPAEILETGSAVEVTRIEGATAMVRARRNGGTAPPELDAPPGAQAAGSGPPGGPGLALPDPAAHDPAALPGGEHPTERPER